MAPYIHPQYSKQSEKRKGIAEVAEVSRLHPFETLNLIGKFALKFGIDPDVVFVDKSFDTVANFLLSWKEEEEFADRYAEVEKSMQPKT